MTNVFKKLIRKEFGDRNYYKYFFCYQNMLYNDDFEIDKVTKDEVYNDIYDKLKNLDMQALKKRHNRLADTMITAFSITNTFLIVIGFYVAALWLLISQGFNPMVAKISIVIISVAFLYKLYEFILNKFCFVDAHIAIIYKTVLENLIENQ
ncbi:MAG: hypothetical protein E7262_04275 [Lachnospiraceae bacterium]|nr:hypothetical protein [Lachnospiraceae bacterium]